MIFDPVEAADLTESKSSSIYCARSPARLFKTLFHHQSRLFPAIPQLLDSVKHCMQQLTTTQPPRDALTALTNQKRRWCSQDSLLLTGMNVLLSENCVAQVIRRKMIFGRLNYVSWPGWP